LSDAALIDEVREEVGLAVGLPVVSLGAHGVVARYEDLITQRDKKAA
jgi:hypothetical protein